MERSGRGHRQVGAGPDALAGEFCAVGEAHAGDSTAVTRRDPVERDGDLGRAGDPAGNGDRRGVRRAIPEDRFHPDRGRSALRDAVGQADAAVRRPGDDVVDLSLRVAMGALCALTGATDTLKVGCKPSDAPAGALALTDGVRKTAADFKVTFPYLNTPLPGNN